MIIDWFCTESLSYTYQEKLQNRHAAPLFTGFDSLTRTSNKEQKMSVVLHVDY